MQITKTTKFNDISPQYHYIQHTWNWITDGLRKNKTVERRIANCSPLALNGTWRHPQESSETAYPKLVLCHPTAIFMINSYIYIYYHK